MVYEQSDFTVGDIIRYTNMYDKKMRGKIGIVTHVLKSSVCIRRTYKYDPEEHTDSEFYVPISKLYFEFIVRQKDVL